MPSFRLSRNLTLLGSPGSGKGYYGRPLAEAWRCRRWEASTLLRANPQTQNLLDSGRLVDCQIVSQTLLDSLQKEQRHQDEVDGYDDDSNNNNSSYFIMDGFPRTRKQIDLMEAEWPTHLHVTHAVLLDVPQGVCVAKIKGRRYCPQCHTHYNTMGYYEGGFDLPPVLPAGNVISRRNEDHADEKITCADCNPREVWQVRADDVQTDIVQRRLAEHAAHEQPIIDYYEQRGRLLRYTPYRGALDLDDMRQTMEAWINSQS